MVQPLWKTDWQFLKKLHVTLPYKPALPLLGIYPREMKTHPHKDQYSDIHISIVSVTGRNNNTNIHQLLNRQNIRYIRRLLLSSKKV